MTCYAVPLSDLDQAWRTPLGTALVDAVLIDDRAQDADEVTVHGLDAVVLVGTDAQVAAVVSGLLAPTVFGDGLGGARVFERVNGAWVQVRTAPMVPAEPDEELPVQRTRRASAASRRRRSRQAATRRARRGASCEPAGGGVVCDDPAAGDRCVPPFPSRAK